MCAGRRACTRSRTRTHNAKTHFISNLLVTSSNFLPCLPKPVLAQRVLIKSAAGAEAVLTEWAWGNALGDF